MERAGVFTFEDALEQLGHCQLGHQRRPDRSVDCAARISRHPGGSWPEKLHDPAAYRATLRLLNQPAVTHTAAQRPAADILTFRLPSGGGGC